MLDDAMALKKCGFQRAEDVSVIPYGLFESWERVRSS